MTAANVTQIYAPDPILMREHAEHLFGGDLDGLHDGLIELAWTKSTPDKDGKHPIIHAHLFGTDRLDDLVEEAVEQNSVPNQSVYIGAALRKPDTPPFGRCGKGDFYGATALWLDVDDEDAADKLVGRFKNLPPSKLVVTGREPHARVQAWWTLDEPIRDKATLERHLGALAAHFDGDAAVVDAARVMRLAGSIAWPLKAGRKVERTDISRRYTLATAPVGLKKLAAVYPVREAQPAAPSAVAGDLGLTGVSVEALIAEAQKPKNWHASILRVVGHWISRGWTDFEILGQAHALTLPGYTVAQTQADLRTMIRTGRDKWGAPNPTHDVQAEEAQRKPALEPTPLGALNIAAIPQRPWIYGRRLLKGRVTVLVAPPGVGKSTLTIQDALAVATGTNWSGDEVYEPGPAWIFNNEDDADELHRRIAAAAIHLGLPLPGLADKLYVNSGTDRALVVARQTPNGQVIATPDVEACIEHIRARGIRLFVVDPFVETHGVEENDNMAIKEVAVLFRRIAQQAGCAVLLVHHTSKPPAGASDGHIGNMNSARGGGSLVGVARIVETLFGMTQRDQERYGIEEGDRHLYVRLDGAKANLSLVTGEARWFQRVGVQIPNGPFGGPGDEVGVLAPADMSAREQAAREAEASAEATLAARMIAFVEAHGPQTVNGLARGMHAEDVAIGDPRMRVLAAYDGAGWANGSAPATLRRLIERLAKARFAVSDAALTLDAVTGKIMVARNPQWVP